MNRREFLRRALLAVPAIVVTADLAHLLERRALIMLPPSGGWPDLSRIVRNAFVPKMVVQIYNSSPLAAAILGRGEARLTAEQMRGPAAWLMENVESSDALWQTQLKELLPKIHSVSDHIGGYIPELDRNNEGLVLDGPRILPP